MTGSVITAGDLDFARLQLDMAVDQLTRPSSERIVRNGELVEAQLPSLLAQLEDGAGSNSGRGSFAPGSKPPVWLDALSLLREIDLEVGHRSRARRGGRHAQVRAWGAAMHGHTDRDALNATVEQAEDWVRRVRALLDPDVTIELVGECPVCHRTHVESPDEDGGQATTVRRHALRGREDPLAVWCTAEDCGYRAEGEALWLLADHLERQTASETLAHEDELGEAG